MKFQARAPSSDPERLGRYRTVVEVAKGYLGRLCVVVAAEGERTCCYGRVVAGETLPQEVAEAARRSQSLEHPHLVAVRDVVDEPHAPLVVVSDYLPGTPLSTFSRLLLARREPPEIGVVVRMIIDALSGVGFLHNAEGYVPGGVAPDSLLIGRDGQVRLLEGHLHGVLATIEPIAGHHERLAYASPEQHGEEPKATRASDLWSVGVMLWELVQRRRLFAGLSPKVVTRKVTEAKVPPLEHAALAEVMARVLAAAPDDRFEDAAEMVAALSSAVDVASHEEVAELYAEVIGGHPSVRRIERAVDEALGRDASAAKPKPPKPPGRRLRDKPTKPEMAKVVPPKPSSPKGDQDAPSSDPGAVLDLLRDSFASDPVPVSVIPFPSDEPPASGPPSASEPPSTKPDRSALTVPVAAKGDGASDVEVPKAPPAPKIDRPASDDSPDASSRKRDRGSGAPHDSIPPLYDVEELTQGGAQRQVGRCELFVEVAQGGMASVHLGRWRGAGGFTKTVAVKALHRQYAGDPAFVSMLLDEARVVARVKHPNVMPIIDLVDDGGDLFIVMEYVHGVTLAHLLRQMLRRKGEVPVGVALRVMSGVLHGLHAAHRATDRVGKPMDIIHRDVSPENIMIGADGFAKVIDFGIARAMGRRTTTHDGQVKGKPSYLSPEQVMAEDLDHRTDVYAAALVLWQTLTGRKLFHADNIAAMSLKILRDEHPAPSDLREGISSELDAIVLKGMSRDKEDRFDDAERMAEELEKLGGLASYREVGEWVRDVAAVRLEHSETMLRAVEAAPLPEEDDDLDEPMRVEAARASLDLPEGPTRQSEHDVTDVTSEQAATFSQPPTGNRTGLLVGTAAVVVALFVGLSLGGESGESASPGTTTTASAAPPPPPAPEPTATAVETAAAHDGSGGAGAKGDGGAPPSPTVQESAKPPPKKWTPPPGWKPPVQPPSKLPDDI